MNNGQDGFTLIEIMVTIVILAIIIIPFSGFFINSINNIFNSGAKSEAVFEGNKHLIHAIYNESYSPDNNDVSINYSGNKSKNIPFSNDDGENTTITINYKKVSCSVNYNDKSITLTSYTQ